MLREHDGDIAHERDVPNHAANDILPCQKILIPRVQVRVISDVVVAFCQ